VILDASGSAVIFLQPALYYVVVRDINGKMIRDLNGIGSAGVGNGSTGTFAIVSNYAALRALTQDYDLIYVLGRSTNLDGGQGFFQQMPSFVADDDGIILVRSTTSYQRQEFNQIDPRWYGVVYNTASDQSVDMVNAITASVFYKLPLNIGIEGAITYLGKNVSFVAGSSAIISGPITGLSTGIQLKFLTGSKLISGSNGCFASNIQPVFEEGICQNLYVSWFTEGSDDSRFSKANQSSIFQYNLILDINVSLVLDLNINSNFAFYPIGGSVITIASNLINISIPNITYSQPLQFINYTSLAYVGTINFGTNYGFFEWFGFVAGTITTLDNSIPGYAGIKTGFVKLFASYYYIKNTGTAWTFTKNLKIIGDPNDNLRTLDINNSINIPNMVIDDCMVTGASTITTIGYINTNDVIVANVVARNSTNTQTINTGAYLPNNVWVGGNHGTVLHSTDLTTWTAASLDVDNILSIAKGPVWLATANSGKIYTSVDGGNTWLYNSLSGNTNQINFVYYANNTYFAIGANGTIFTSSDSISWNNHSISSATFTFKSMTYFNSTYIFVGTAGKIYTSTDLSTYILRAIPSGITGDIYTITNNGITAICAGALNGNYLLSTNGLSWAGYILSGADTIYGSSSDSKNIVLVGSSGLNGCVYQSSSNGYTFQKLITSLTSMTLFGASNSNGSWYFAASSGRVVISSDLTNFKIYNTGSSYDLLTIFEVSPIYALGGQANTLQTSIDGVNWTTVTIDGTIYNINRIRILNGIAWILRDNGSLIYTSDFVNFKTVTTGTSANLFDITYNTSTSKYILTGSAGYMSWIGMASITSPTPTFTVLTALTSNDLHYVVQNGTNYQFIGANTQIVSTDLTNANTTLINYHINGMLIASSLYVQYGNSGLILTSPDKITWTKQTSGTTNNLLCGVVNGSTLVLAGASGTLIYSTNAGVTWTSVSATSNQINSIMFDGTNYLIACSNHSSFYSSNLTTWSTLTSTTGTGNYWSLWKRGSEYNIIGDSGQWFYGTTLGGAFSTRATGVTATLYVGNGNLVVGASGTVLSIASGTVTNYTTNYNITADLIKNSNNVIVDSTGKIWVGSDAGTQMTSGNLTDSVIRNMAYDSTNKIYYAVGDSTYTSTSGYKWSKILTALVGINDVTVSSTTYYVAGNTGLYASSTNGVLWVWLGVDNYTANWYSVNWIQYSGRTYPDTTVTVFVNGSRIILVNGSSISSGSSISMPSLVCNTGNIVNSSILVGITSTGNVNTDNSTIRTISNIGTITDSTLLYQSGNLNGNVLRSSLTFSTTISIPNNITITESNLIKTVLYDPANNPLINFGGSLLTINSSDIEVNGMLLYSENTSANIILNACTNSNNFNFALTNGYAQVTINYSNVAKNSTITTINGVNLTTNGISVGASNYPTSSLTNWNGLPAGTTVSGNTFTTVADTTLSGDPSSLSTFRFAGTDNTFQLLESLGGRLALEIVYPTGYTPDPNSQIVAQLYKPSQSIHSVASPYYIGQANNPITLGNCTPIGINKTAGKVMSYTNVWGGLAKLSTPFGFSTLTLIDNWNDISSLVTGGVLVLPKTSRIVIYSTGLSKIPSGTKITLQIIPVLPTTTSAYNTFFNDYVATIDAYQGVEQQNLQFLSADASGIKAIRKVQSGSGITTDIQYLSFGAQGFPLPHISYTKYAIDSFKTTYTYPTIPSSPLSYYLYTDKSQLYPGITNSTNYVEILLRGFADSAITTQSYGQYYGSGAAVDTAEYIGSGFDTTKQYWYSKPRKHVIENNVWKLVADHDMVNINGILS
jgi:photosystem II stability/assembly factor-like uncharacterized protein